MVDAIVLDGTITLIALGALAVELLAILLYAVLRRSPPAGHLIVNLLSGLFLILALRAALLDHESSAVALFLGLAGVTHLLDVVLRLRRRGTEQRR